MAELLLFMRLTTLLKQQLDSIIYMFIVCDWEFFWKLCVSMHMGELVCLNYVSSITYQVQYSRFARYISAFKVCHHSDMGVAYQFELIGSRSLIRCESFVVFNLHILAV